MSKWCPVLLTCSKAQYLSDSWKLNFVGFRVLAAGFDDLTPDDVGWRSFRKFMDSN